MQVQLNRVVHDILKQAVKANRIDPIIIIIMATFPCRQLINSSFPLIKYYQRLNGTICRLQSELDKANGVIQEDSAKLLMGCDGCQFLTVDDESSFILPRQRSVPVDGLETTTTRHTCDAIAVRKAYFAVQAG
ncbi:hypothetical protein T11_12224 [Trichinella zimbabwensis]|uniref:Uncharacterized protein n=1 Tax=Trichinella zimbabwensis TaxID=268475 RepID=A0A0V1HD44_9BILA|nr:hypothetical protein T11_12224 [Trichinella zimbabwensis]